MAATTSYKDSPVWQQAVRLALDTYSFTAALPPAEKLSLSLQLQQTAITIPGILAAGSRSGGKDGLAKACTQALAELARLETLLIITGQQYPTIDNQAVLEQHDQVERMLKVLQQRLRTPPAPKRVV